MAGDHQGDIDDHGIAQNQGDLPSGVIERARGGMKDRGGQAGPGVGGSGVHGMQDDDNRAAPERDRRDEARNK
jgi:hypothetical protein